MKKTIDTGMAISLKGLALGVHHYLWSLERDFFASFENQEIIDAHVDVRVTLEREVDMITLRYAFQGSVLRACDRCLGDVFTPFSYNELETIALKPNQDVLDLSQYLYDSVCVNLPLQTLHPPDQCDPIMVQKLSELSVN